MTQPEMLHNDVLIGWIEEIIDRIEEGNATAADKANLAKYRDVLLGRGSKEFTANECAEGVVVEYSAWEPDTDQESLGGVKIAALCDIAIDIMNQGEDCAEEAGEYLRAANRWIVRKAAFGAVVAAIVAYIAAIGAGLLAQHLAGGVIETASLHTVQGVAAFAALIITAVASGERLRAVENWTSALVPYRRRELEAQRREDEVKQDD